MWCCTLIHTKIRFTSLLVYQRLHRYHGLNNDKCQQDVERMLVCCFLVWVSASIRLDEVCEFNDVLHIVAAINCCVPHHKVCGSGRSSSSSFIKFTLRFYPSHVFTKPDKIFLNPSENIGNLERKMVFTSRILYTRCIPLIFAAPHVSAQQAQCKSLIIFFI